MSETVLSATAIQFFVHGLPVPQGSKKVIGRNVIEMADARLRSWRQDVASTAKSVMAQEGAEAGIEPVDVRLMFFLPRPQGHYGSGRNANRLKPSAPATPAVHPDLDKLVRSVLDALTGVCFDVLPGEVHALLGENGAGKSTLMNVASGTTTPDSGTIVFDGAPVENLTPAVAQELGIAIVHQHPALLPDLTVAENFRLAVGLEHLRRRDPDTTRAMRALLDDVHFTGHLEDRVSSLSVARRHLLELAKAFAVSPRLLILDEPTAPLSQDSVELLFTSVRALAGEGTAVVYITHRLGEVRQIADRVTVLRDGALRGTSAVKDISDADLLAMIIGRTLATTFPAKNVAADGEAPLLRVEGLSGNGFENISLSVRKGEIVGIAGVIGNGQPALVRALAGREPATGSVKVRDRALSRRALLHSAAYMPADRLAEGLMVDLNVRENSAMTALDRLRRGPFVSRQRETTAVARELSELDVKAPSLEAPVSSLSGGNQQKIVMARAMLSEPAVLVADEPTQGVDVGARAEIYRILREVAARGVPVVVASSDTKELEGLCDRVIVMSRGQAVATLEGDAVTEERMVHAAISATMHTSEKEARRQRGVSRLSRFIEGDYAPVLVLALVILALGAYVLSHNSRYLSSYNVNSVMFACAALGFISLGQTFALLLGGIDLSVGPLAGFLVVLASFFVLDGRSPAVWALGFVLMFLCAVGIGLLNGALIRYAKFTPVAATLVTYIGLGGLAFRLRSSVPTRPGIRRGTDPFPNPPAFAEPGSRLSILRNGHPAACPLVGSRPAAIAISAPTPSTR